MPVFPARKEHIAIIGGGISGIIAAKQLRYFGFKVTVFETMLRFGGRICTIRNEFIKLPTANLCSQKFLKAFTVKPHYTLTSGTENNSHYTLTLIS